MKGGEVSSLKYIRSNVLVYTRSSISYSPKLGSRMALTPTRRLRLHRASEGGDLNTIEQCIAAGYDLNFLDDEGRSPLFGAIKYDQSGAAKKLLDSGCDPSIKDKKAYFPLLFAADKGANDMVTMLVDSNADIEAMDRRTLTSLLLAASKGHADVVLTLITKGADINKPELSSGRTALYRASLSGHDHVVKILINGKADVNRKDRKQCTPLHAAAASAHHKCVLLLLGAGAQINATHMHGQTPLHESARKGCCEVIEILLSGGADLTIADDEDMVPLELAAVSNHAKAVKLLLEAGSSPNRRNAAGENILFLPLELDIVKILLEGGASANLLRNDGSTVLHAICGGSQKPETGVICALAKAGADPSLKNKYGRTAAACARSANHSEAAKMLELLVAKNMSSGVICSSIPAPQLHTTASFYRKVEESRAKNPGDIARETVCGLFDVCIAPLFNRDDGNNQQRPKSIVDVLGEALIGLHVWGKFHALRYDHLPKIENEIVKESVGRCLNCDTVTERRCSACGSSCFCTRACELSAQHLCCG